MSKFLKNRWLISLILLVLASVVVFKPNSNNASSSDAGGTSAPPASGVGISSFEFQQPDGKAVNFATSEDVIVVHFWATWCAPCIHELPELDKYIATQKPANVRVIPIALDGYQHSEKVQNFLAEHKLGNIAGNIGQFAKLRTPLGLRNLPVTIIVGDGEVIHRVDGPVEWGDFVIPE